MSDSIQNKLSDDIAEKADMIRKKYQYRRLIMKRKTSLSHASAVRLIGPDSAYHLYRHISRDSRPFGPFDATE